MSNETVMPPHDIVQTADVDLVTIPFHLSFQQLLDSLGATNSTQLATAISHFQKCALSREERARLSAEEKKFLRKLDISLSDIETARRAFAETDGEKLARRSGAPFGSTATSPLRGLGSDWASAGS
jgi:hypothetical protein